MKGKAKIGPEVVKPPSVTRLLDGDWKDFV